MAFSTYKPSAEGGVLSISKNGAEFVPLRNFSDFTVSGGDRQETTSELVDAGSESTVGAAQPKDLSVTLQPSPGAEGYEIAYQYGYREGNRVWLRYETEETEAAAFTGIEAKFDAPAEVMSTGQSLVRITFTRVSGNNTAVIPDPREVFRPGQMIKVKGGTTGSPVQYQLILERNEGSGTGLGYWEVDKCAGRVVSSGTFSAITTPTASWRLTDYGLRYTWTCNILSADNPTFSTGGNPLTDNLSAKMTEADAVVRAYVAADVS